MHRLSVERGPSLDSRVPYGRNGRFGSVFKFTGDGETLALKVFVRNSPNRQLRYRLIGEHLAQSAPATPRLISFKYDDQGIRVKGAWYPALVMDWSSGIPLDKYLTERLKSPPVDHARLCNEWVRTVRDLKSRKIAHGDLQHENILVKDDGTFQLIDYDGMFVPPMRDHKLRAAEVGRPAYQHPARSARPYRTDYFDERLDDFSALLILLSLASTDTRTWTAHHNDDDKLIIGEEDLRQPSESSLLVGLAKRPGPVSKLTHLLVQAAAGDIEAVPSFEAVVADPDVQALLNGTTARPRRSVRGSLLPQFPDELASTARAVDVAKPPARISPAGRAPAKVRQAATPDLPRREAAIVELTSGEAATVELTSREVEVARLVAKGSSAAEIAGELTLARGTVDRYLRTLRTKAGTDSMEALTSWARAKFPPPPERPGSRQSPRTRTPQKKRKAQAGPRRPASQPTAPQPTTLPPRVAAAREKPTPVLPNLNQFGLDPSFFRLLERQDPEAARLTAEGEALLLASRNQEAFQVFDRALLQQSKYVPALLGRAEARRRMGRFQEALNDLDLALSLEPTNVRALQVRSETNRDAGRKFRAWADRVRARRRGGRNT